MPWLSNFLLLAAELDAEESSVDYLHILKIVSAVAAVLIVPFVLGNYLSKKLRMADYGWKIGLIFCTVLAGSVVVFLGVKNDKIRLAIDLKGGTRLIYEVDEEQRLRDGTDEAVMKVEQRFRSGENDEMIVGSPATGEVHIKVPAGDAARNKRIEAETTSLEIQGGSLVMRSTGVEDVVDNGDPFRLHKYTLEAQTEKGQVQMDKLGAAVARRINPGGVREIIIRPAGYGRLEIVIPITADEDEEEVESIKRKISTAGVLVFRILADRRNSDHTLAIFRAEEDENKGSKDVRAGLRTIARWVEVNPQTGKEAKNGEVDVHNGYNVTRTIGEKTEVLVIVDRFNVTGGYLTGASRSMGDRGLAVSFSFNAAGAKRFGEFTSENQKDKDTGRLSRLGIVLDGRLLSAPDLLGTISDQGQITGKFNDKDIEFLVGVLNAGSLPTALHERPISEQKMSATTGAAMIRKGKFAMAASLVVVLVFMIFYYRFSGVVAAFAVVLNLVLILALMISIKAAFSLAGIAGLVLTVGMAVDANVLIFERIREELNRGSALRLAIRNGFSRATRTIVDANLTTLIVAVVLFVIGRDQLKSFAVTLFLGILLSMYTAIFCSRVIFDIAERKRWITRLNMMKLLGEKKFDFVGKRRPAAVVSCLLIVLGLIGVFLRGNGLLDIDFTGGVSVQVQFKEPMDENVVRSLIRDAKNADGSPKLPDHTVAAVGDADDNGNYLEFKIDTSIHEDTDEGVSPQDQVRAVLIETFGDRLERYSMETVGEVVEVAATKRIIPGFDFLTPGIGKLAETVKPTEKKQPPEKKESEKKESEKKETEKNPAKESDAAPGKSETSPPSADKKEATPASPKSSTDEGASTLLPAGTLIASTDAGAVLLAQAPKAAKEPKAAAKPQADFPANPDPKVEPNEATPPKKTDPPKKTAPEKEPPAGKIDDPLANVAPVEPGLLTSQATLKFPKKISYNTLEAEIKDALKLAVKAGTARNVSFTLSNKGYKAEGGKSHAYEQWQVKFLGLNKAEANAVLEIIKAELAKRPIFPSINDIGGQVAGDTQQAAIVALFVSLMAIVGYIWLRFNKVMYGLAAVVALVHDVIITLGMIALSYWVAPYLGILMIDPFKISLPVLAAFLTIIGYSLNDTIVVFDRIREVKGKSPNLTEEMVNTSINQTLSRTLLTSMTTLVVVGILYWWGGQGIHGFAFALLVGVIVGTYSSIFVASPVLLWMSKSAETPVVKKSSKAEPAGV